jgi:hypothetical protein
VSTALENTDSVLKLRRFLAPRRQRAPGAYCELCSEAIPADRHSHIVNLPTRRLLCACRACYLLFTNPAAANGKYKAVPRRYLAASGGVFNGVVWDELQIPVGIAFFFFHSTAGRLFAFYPSPAGATESLLPMNVWEEMAASSPLLRSLAADVEALLVRKSQFGAESYIVPIDACYELAGRIRRGWKGLDGGQAVREEIETFFAKVRAQSSAPGGG